MRVLQPVRGRCGHWPLVAGGVAELVSVGSSEIVENGGATGAYRKRERVSVMKEEGYWVTANLESYRRGTP